VPARIDDANGVHGLPLGAFPPGFAGLLHNQVAVHDLTAEAILQGSRQLALQALLVDPVVHSYRAAQQTLDTMLELQPNWLGYLNPHKSISRSQHKRLPQDVQS
jgi:alpha-galactosidase